MEKTARVDITVRGEVQAVGYRYIVQSIARRLGVKGYVQNMPDGTVKITAEASENIVQSFIEALDVKEPPVAVEDIEVTYSQPTGEFQYFTTKHGDPTDEMYEGFGTGLRYMDLSRHEMREGFQTMRTEMKEGFENLGGELKGMREDMNRNFKEMSEEYDAISQSLGQAIKMIQEESTKTRNELIRAVDKLSALIDEFVRTSRRVPPT